MEAIGSYNFDGSDVDELSFRKGDVVKVKRQVTPFYVYQVAIIIQKLNSNADLSHE